MTRYVEKIEDFFTNGELQIDSLIDLPVASNVLPHGWMTDLELKLLYNLARLGKGDFLEIGSYIGRSTVAIAAGFRDAPSSGNRNLDVCDLGLTSIEEGCSALAVGPAAFHEDGILRAIFGRGGVVGQLIDNLRQHDVLKYVTSIVRGDAAKVPLRSGYEIVFCDATHTLREIDIIGPTLSQVLAPGGWLVCDDIHSNRDLVEAIGRYVSLEFFFLLSNFAPEHKVAVGRISRRG